MNDIVDRACQCFVEYLGTSPTLTDQVYNAKRTDDIETRSISVDAVNVEEDPAGVGNFLMDIECIARTMAPTDSDGIDPKIASDALTQSMLELLEIDNESLKSSLNVLIPNFCVQGFGNLKHIERTYNGDAWITTWRRRIYCGGFTDS